MQLIKSIQNVFLQLHGSLKMLNDDQYKQPVAALFGATIGAHTRHIIEMFQCLEQGYEAGLVNYELRKRDSNIETSREFAINLLHKVYESLNKADKAMQLHATYNDDSDELMIFNTNYYREVAYNLEHTIHHMALIRVGINQISNVTLPDGFGVASSTIKHKKSCAQ
jgi:hypothetical protein